MHIAREREDFTSAQTPGEVNMQGREDMKKQH